jgi:ABC-2 type transport system permease protein
MTVSIDHHDHAGRATAVETPRSGRMRSKRSQFSMMFHQAHYEGLGLVRNRTAQGFAFGMPIAFLVLFAAIFGNGTMDVDGHAVKGSTYYVAALTVFAIVDVAFMNLAIGLVQHREAGVLRRRRATPQPAWTVIAGLALTTVVSSTLSAALLLGVGRVAYGATVSPGALPALLLAVVAGVVVFCCLGFAVAGLVRSVDSAQPVVTALALPLMFISGVFIPWSLVPHWLQQVSLVFPVRPLTVVVLDPYLAHGARGSWDPVGLAVLGAWGLVAVIGALRWFRWAPRGV